jgi:translocation and assembly module TamA
MAHGNFQPRARRRHWRGPWLALCLLAAGVVQAAAGGVDVDIHGVDEQLRNNVLAYLSFQRYQKGGADLTADVVDRLHNRVEREVDDALRPLGYYEPKVDSTVTDEGGNKWKVVINIDPGEPVLVAHIDVRVDGPGETDPLFTRILRHLPLHTGDRLNQALYETIKTDLQRTAATYGYVDAKMIRNELVVDPPKHTANIALEMDTGQRYRFGATTIEQRVVRESLVRRYLRYHQGEPYDLTQVLRTQFALDDAGYFASLEVQPGAPDRENLTVPIKITAKASRRHRYSVGGGYATDTGVRGTLGFEDKRINDRGHTFGVSIQAAQVTKYYVNSHYRIPIGDPALENISLNATIEQQTLADVTATTQSLGPAFTDVIDRWQTVWQVNAVRTTSTDLNGSDTDRLLVPELDIASVPKGYLGEALFEHPLFFEIKGSDAALGSDANFLQVHLQAEKVFNIGRKWHLLLRNEIGATFASHETQLPVYYRFFAGGDNSVRGFAYNELSPYEAVNCVQNAQGVRTPNSNCAPGLVAGYIKTGGKDVFTGTFEVIRDLPRSLGVAAFIDYGNALNSFKAPGCLAGPYSIVNGTQVQSGPVCTPFIQYSVGIGLRVRLPVMTLGIDIAQPLSINAGPRLHINFSPKL